MTQQQFIKTQVSKIQEGFSLEQIREETWKYTLKDIGQSCRLEAVIYGAMDLYSHIIEESKNELRNLR